MVPLNRKFSCSTTPRLRAQVIDVVFADIDTVDLDQALVVRVQPLQEAGDRGFAGAAAAHDAERRALGTSKVTPFERRRDRPLILEAHLGELTSPLSGVRTPWPERPSSGGWLTRLPTTRPRSAPRRTD